MKVDGRHFRSIWLEDDGWTVGAIDQRRLPHEFVVARIASAEDATEAIRSMLVRGAPLIGATAAYGMALAMRTEASDAALDRAYAMLLAARPTAINLKWALDEMQRLLRPLPASERAAAAYTARGRNRRGGRCDQPGDRPAWSGADRTDRGEEGAGRARQRPDALQRRLARHRRLGHGDGADLSRA